MDQEIRCDSPHTVEFLGATSLGSTPVSAAEIREACTVYAGRALRTADPTRDSAIHPEILAYARDAAIIPPIDSTLANRYVDCVLIAENGRHLINIPCRDRSTTTATRLTLGSEGMTPERV